MKVRFKVEKDLCIPAMACIVAEPDMYELDDDGKAEVKKNLDIDSIKETAKENDWTVVETSEAGFERIVESAKICPVLAILVEKFDEEINDWRRIYPE
jgi:ferredoxin